MHLARHMALAVVLSACAAPAIACDFGRAHGWGVTVPELEFHNASLSNVVVELNALLARHTTNTPPFTVRVVQKTDGGQVPVPLSSPRLQSGYEVTLTARHINLGCAVLIITKVAGTGVGTTPQGPLIVLPAEAPPEEIDAGAR